MNFTRPRDGSVATTARVLSSAAAAAAAMAARGRAQLAGAAECFLGKENREEDLALAVGGARGRSTPGQGTPRRAEHHLLPHDLVVSAWEDRTGRRLAFPSSPSSFSSPAAFYFLPVAPHRTERGPLISPLFF